MRTRIPAVVLLCAPAVVQAASPIGSYAQLPLAFERQAHLFVAQGDGYRIVLEGGSATVGGVSMEFAGARKPVGTPGRELPGKVNYLRGNDPAKWRIGLATYERVTYPSIYPGIDVVYRGNRRQMEFDLVLKPGADPRRIRLRFHGAGEVVLAADGGLMVGDLRIPLPVVYQGTVSIPSRYQLLPGGEVGFQVDAYDRSRALVIDPTIVYSSQIGGGTGATQAQAIAVDSEGNAYIAGTTNANDFPTANAAFPHLTGSNDGFVSKIDPTGTTLLYSTYIGSYANLNSIAVDSAGEAWVAGYAMSSNFPVLNAYQSNLSGFTSAVVLKLGATGALLFSTFLGSNSQAKGIAVDPAQSAYVTGSVDGTIPTTTGALLSAPAGSTDAFVAKFNSSGSLAYSTYLGGAGVDRAYGIAADGTGNAYVTGVSLSASFVHAPAGGAQSRNAGGDNAFVAKLNPAGSALVYFTFLGGSQGDWGNAIAVDGNGNAYIGGSANSADLPVTVGALQTIYGGDADGFVAKLNSAGSAFSYVTYLGGSRLESVTGLAVDGDGNVYVTGSTESSQFPTVTPIQPVHSASGTSLYRTTNGGGLWNIFDTNLPSPVYDVSPDPTPGTLIVETESGIYRTVNSGQSWTRTSQILGAIFSRSPANSSVIYTVECCSQVYRSADGGITWNAQGAIGSGIRPVADGSNANVVYGLGGESAPIQVSIDGGMTWNPAAGSGLPLPRLSFAAAADGSLYADTLQGVYKSTDQAASWSPAGTGLQIGVAPTNLAVSPSNPAVLYRSTFSNRIYVSTNGGASWAPASGVAPVMLGMLTVSGTNPSLVYATASPGYPAIYQSPDGGATWSPTGPGLNVVDTVPGLSIISEMVSDPGNSSGVYAVALVNYSAFAAEINPTGSALVYSTYLGGSYATTGLGIAVESHGDAFVAGYNSGAFPVTGTALQGDLNQNQAFVVRISAATARCTVTVNPGDQTIYGSPSTLVYSVTAPSGCAWTASSNQPWAAVALGGSGTGAGMAVVNVEANNGASSRTAAFTIGDRSVSMTQAASSCSFSLDPASASVGGSGGAVRINVSTGSGCPWSVVNTYPFAVSVTSGASGTGSGTVVLSVPASAPTSRSMYLDIAGVSFSLSQAGNCTYSTNPATLQLSVQGASGSVAVTTQNGCPWTAYSYDTSWITVASNSGSGNGSFSYTATANTAASRGTSLNVAGRVIPIAQASGQTYLISTLSGGGAEPPTTVPAAAVAIANLNGLAADSSGNVYFSDAILHSVFRVDPAGLLTRIAGTGIAGFSGDGGVAVSAQLSSPSGVAVDAAGNIYIADSYNQRIRKVAPNGVITTIAGTGTVGYSGDGGPATSAQLYNPAGVAVDSLGNLYIADSDNNCVRKVSGDGTITTAAGTGIAGYSGDGGLATSAQLSFPYAVAADSAGNLYIADFERVRRVDSSGLISTLAGNGQCCFSFADGVPATTVQIDPVGLAVDSLGNLFIADGSNERIRRVNASGATKGWIFTVAGYGSPGYSGDGGPATLAQLSGANGVAVDPFGNLVVADNGNARIRVTSTAGYISSLAGGRIVDGVPAPFGSLQSPAGVAFDNLGNIYVSDSGNNRIRKISPDGVISTAAGTGVPGYSGDGAAGASAQLTNPQGIAVDQAGNVYIADYQNNRVRRLSTGGTITTAAGNGTCCSSGDGGPATAAQLANPEGVATDPFGNLYIADTYGQVIRKVDALGVITTVAGNGVYGGGGDGGPATSASLNYPFAVAADSLGNLYIADTNNNRVRKVAPNGLIGTVAGTGTSGYSGDGGPATQAQLGFPGGIAVDSSGNLYIADGSNARVRLVDSSGTITTIAGSGSCCYPGDGVPALSAGVRFGAGLSLDSAGTVYFAEPADNAIRRLTPAGVQPVLTVESQTNGNFTQGQTGAAYTLTVANAGGAGPTSGTVTLTEIPPGDLTLTSMSGLGWTCAGATCTRSSALSGGSTYPPILVSVNVSSTAPWQITNQATVSVDGILAGAEHLTIVDANAPSLAVTSTHFGNFSPGQTNATYTLTIGNRPAAPATNGTVSVTETLPSGLTLGSMSGAGWTCSDATCTRDDSVSAGAAYPPITVTVSVDAIAPSQVVNLVSAVGGGSVQATATDPTTIGANLCAIDQDGNASVPDIREMLVEALGLTQAPVLARLAHDLNHDGDLNVVDVQMVLNAASRLGCPVF